MTATPLAMNARTIAAALGLLIAISGASYEARAQSAPTTPPPARLPSASPPVPAPVREVTTPGAASSTSRLPLLAPAVIPPPPAPVAASRITQAQISEPANVAPPADATMRCKDGSYLTGEPVADRCRERGGVAVILPQRPKTP